jgi:hypothetical protein
MRKENSIRIYIIIPPISQSTISKIEVQYRNLGHVKVVLRKREPTVGEDTQLNVL